MSEDTKVSTEVHTQGPLSIMPPTSESVPTESVKAAKVVKPIKVPTSGQSGPPLNLKWDKMNPKEQSIVRFLFGTGTGTRPIVTISTIASECFFGEADTEALANSWTRNSLRRLVRGEWVEKFVRGSFRITTKGRARFQEAAVDTP
jgi:hypothetical protein